MKKEISVSEMRILLFSAFFLFSCVFLGSFGNLPVFAPAAAQDDMDDEEEEEDEDDFKNLTIPKPVELTGEVLKTSDGVLLSATFYPGNRGKKSVPLILIHGWDGSRKDFTTLALHLQEEGHAVLVPDLRGHGKSTQKELQPEVYKKIDTKNQAVIFAEMLKYDLPVLKAFLRAENNKGNLNIDKLGLVGIESGAILAAAYAAEDWSPNIKRTNKANPKMGDVKAIVLISPLKIFAKVKLADQFTKNPLWMQNFSALVLCGSNPPSTIEVPDKLEKAMLAVMKKAGGEDKTIVLNEDGTKSEKGGAKKVFAVTMPSKLQGAKLIAKAEGSVELPTIAHFVNLRLKKRPFTWVLR